MGSSVAGGSSIPLNVTQSDNVGLQSCPGPDVEHIFEKPTFPTSAVVSSRGVGRTISRLQPFLGHRRLTALLERSATKGN